MRRLVIALFALAFGLLPGRVRAQNDIITTFAGGGPSNLPAVPVNPNPPQTAANLNQPTSVAVDGSGNIYTASPAQHRVFKVDVMGTLTVFAGNGTPGSGNECTQGNSPTGCDLPIHTALHSPQAVAVDSSGNVFIADSQNNLIRMVNTQSSAITVAGVLIQPGAIATVAGNGGSGFSGDDGLATDAKLARPFGLAIDANENLYIADIDNNRVREVDNTTGKIKTVAGNGAPGFSGDGGPAVAASLDQPTSVAVDPGGNLYISDSLNHRVRVVDSSHVITTFAGNGGPPSPCTTGSPPTPVSGKATALGLSDRTGLATLSAGDVFIADTDAGCVREVTGGVMTTVAGSGSFGFGGDGGPAVDASLNGPLGVGVDSHGNLFIADTGNLRVREVRGTISTVAGNGLSYGGDGSLATDASLKSPQGVATDAAGNVFVADSDDNLIRVVNTQATPVTVAGVVIAPGTLMAVPPSSGLNGPTGVGVDQAENVFIADAANQRMLKVDSSGNLSTIAGDGCVGYSLLAPACTSDPSAGDGVPAANASLNFPTSVALDASGNLYIADTDNHRIRAVNLQLGPVTLFGVLIQPGYIATVAGSGTASSDPTTACAETGAATSAELNFPAGIALDSSGNLYIADRANHCIRRVDSTGQISTVAGDGTQGFSGDGGPATSAELNLPSSVAVDSTGNLYIADFGNQAVRRVDASTQVITTVAGSGVFGFSGDNGPAYAAMLANPSGVAVNSGNLFIADTLNDRIREVTGPAAPAVSLSPPSVSFGDQLIATESQSSKVTLSNTGGAPLNLSSFVFTTDFGLAPNTTCPTNSSLPAGQSCDIMIVFKPSFAGVEEGTLTIFDDAPGQPQIVRLSGTGVQSSAVLSSTNLLFGDQLIGTTSGPQGLTLQNNGSAPLTVSSAISGDFTEIDNCPVKPLSLATGASCTYNVVFTPTAGGLRNGSLTITESADNNPRIVNLTGTGVGPGISLSQASLAFVFPQGVGTTSDAVPVTISSTGTAPLTLSGFGFGGANPSDFAQTNNCPTSVPPLTTCTINVTFTPTATGARSGTLTIMSNVSGPATTVALSGTGVPGYAMTVDRTSATVLKGMDSAVFNVSASSQFNFSGTISLSCAGNPAPACSFNPASISAGQNSVLTVSGLGPLQSGSLNFTVIGTSGSQSPSVALTIFIADYSLSASATAATVTAGQTATYTLKIQPSGGFNQPVSFSCSGAPLAATCSVSPVAVTPDGTNPASATVTVTTTALSSAQAPGPFAPRWPRAPGGLPWLFWLVTLSGMTLYVCLRRRRVRYFLVVCAAAVLAWAACGGGSGQLPILKGTPSGTYALTVSATSGSLSHTVNLTLTVN